jgi:hypothetical protein
MGTTNDQIRVSGAPRFLSYILIVTSLLCGAALGAEPAAANDVRHQLLVYYGDETSARASKSANYAALLEVLHASTNRRAAIVAESVVTDAERFPLLVRRDVEALKVQAQRLGFDLAIFTNALAFEGEYQLFRAETGMTETHKLPDIPFTSSTILATSPLSRPEYLRAGLLSVSALFPAKSLDMIVITNSHGGRDMALIPRVNADLSQTGAALAMREMLESDDNGVPPAWAQPQGTSKLAYWQILEEVSAAHGVNFPIVFRETCVSGVRSFSELFAIPDSVGEIAHSGIGDITGWDLDYEQMLGTVAPGSDLVASLVAALKERNIHVDTRGTMWLGVLLVALRSIPSAMFFIPLALWLVWYASRRLIRRTKVSGVGTWPGDVEAAADKDARPEPREAFDAR